MTSKVFKSTAKAVAKAIGVPLKDWPGNCYAIASMMLKKKLVTGKLRYGHWLGGVVGGGIFHDDTPFQRHGWIEVSKDNVVDPTRWVFEAEEPYIYVGPSEGLYDVGGNTFRLSNYRDCPIFEANAKSIKLPQIEAGDHLRDMMMLPGNVATMDQVFWLANQAPDRLGDYAIDIYAWLDKQKLKALIPIDNWNYVMGG